MFGESCLRHAWAAVRELWRVENTKSLTSKILGALVQLPPPRLRRRLQSTRQGELGGGAVEGNRRL